jgi:hypothetical protein
MGFEFFLQKYQFDDIKSTSLNLNEETNLEMVPLFRLDLE